MNNVLIMKDKAAFNKLSLMALQQAHIAGYWLGQNFVVQKNRRGLLGIMTRDQLNTLLNEV